MSKLQIIEDKTGNVVREFDTTGKSERQIDKLRGGIGINLNWGDYSIREVGDE